MLKSPQNMSRFHPWLLVSMPPTSACGFVRVCLTRASTATAQRPNNSCCPDTHRGHQNMQRTTHDSALIYLGADHLPSVSRAAETLPRVTVTRLTGYDYGRSAHPASDPAPMPTPTPATGQGRSVWSSARRCLSWSTAGHGRCGSG